MKKKNITSTELVPTVSHVSPWASWLCRHVARTRRFVIQNALLLLRNFPKLCLSVGSFLYALTPSHYRHSLLLRFTIVPCFTVSSFFCVCLALCFCSNGKVQSLMLCVNLFPAKLLLFLLLLTRLTFLVCNRAKLHLFGTIHKLFVFVWCVVSHFVMSKFHISSLWLPQTKHLFYTNSCFLLHINVLKAQ